MAAFDIFKKKKAGEEHAEPTEAPLPEQDDYSENLTELPEFPTMPDERITPLPRIENTEDLGKSSIKIPPLNEDIIRRPGFREIITDHNTYQPREEEKYRNDEVPDFPSSLLEEEQDAPDFQPSIEEDEETEEFKPKEKAAPQKENIFDEHDEGPLYINVEKCSGIMMHVDVKGIEKNFELSIAEIEKINEKDEAELKNLNKSLEGLQKKIMIIDDIISKG